MTGDPLATLREVEGQWLSTALRAFWGRALEEMRCPLHCGGLGPFLPLSGPQTPTHPTSLLGTVCISVSLGEISASQRRVGGQFL